MTGALAVMGTGFERGALPDLHGGPARLSPDPRAPSSSRA